MKLQKLLNESKMSNGMKKYILFSIIAVSALWVFSPGYASAATNRYIRAGASGDGTSWANAYGNIPKSGEYAQLLRDYTYYVASGNYSITSNTYIDTVEDGQKYITIKKATIGEHGCGVECGWQDSYDTGNGGQAIFIGTGGNVLEIDRGYVIIDGVTGGGPGNWNTGHGFTFMQNNCSIWRPIFDGGRAVTDVKITHVRFESACATPSDATCGGYITGIQNDSGTNRFEVSYCSFYDFHGVALQLHYWANAIIKYNYFYHLQTGAANCHAQSISTHGGDSNISIFGNYFQSVDSGTYIINTQDAPQVNGVDFYNNIVDSSQGCMGMSNYDLHPYFMNVRFHNNVIYNHTGGYASYSLEAFKSVAPPDNWVAVQASNYAYNNIFFECNGGPGFIGVGNHDYNYYGSADCGDQNEGNDIRTTDDPFTSALGHIFTLKTGSLAINTGATLGSLYNIDMNGVSRPQGLAWDMGVYEYTGTSPSPSSTPTPTPYCGDGSCNGNETCSSCLSDCGSCSGLPDLIVTDISWSPTSPQIGDAVTFSATIKNQGTGSTPSGIIHGVLFIVDSQTYVWSDNYTSSLIPGASVTITVNDGPIGSATWIATAGTHSVLANVDDINRIAESNESNNTLTETLTVGTTDTTPPAAPSGVAVS